MPLAQRQALGIAVMSYDGHLGFGLLGDYDALPDLDEIALDLKWAIASLARAAGVRPSAGKATSKSKTARANGNGRARASAKHAAAERDAVSKPTGA